MRDRDVGALAMHLDPAAAVPRPGRVGVERHSTIAPSQRFIDLEVFATQAEALDRLTLIAKAWIDNEVDKDKLSLPSNFAGFQ